MDYHNQTGFFIALITLIVMLTVVNKYLKIKRKHISLFNEQERRRNPNQTGDVWNISGRVARERPVTSEPTTRWPTHDNHISVDSFVIPETFQPYKMDKIPPPPYCEVDLPTYEQATIDPKDTIVPSIHVTPSSSRVVN